MPRSPGIVPSSTTFSTILRETPAWVQWVFDIRYFVRTMISLAIVSFGFFGFVFGNRAIRFFIAWTIITISGMIIWGLIIWVVVEVGR